MSEVSREHGEPLRHGAVVERLWRAAREGRLPHALAFEGREGTGRFLAARWFARGLLCAQGPGRPCDACGPCKRTLAGVHADLLEVDARAEGEERILIHRIARRAGEGRGEGPVESVESFLDLKALESPWRLVLLREAHRMNTAAQNALLKTLEEPRPGTVLVLETHRASSLLATILSRCVRVRFDALEPEECARVLTAAGVAEVEARQLARWSEGSPGAALADRSRGLAAILGPLDEVLAGAPPLRVAARLWETEGEFLGRTPTARARERARFVLGTALALVRDARRVQAGVPAEALAHGERVQGLAARGDGELRRTLAALLEARSDVERNLAPEAILERALLALGGARPILGR